MSTDESDTDLSDASLYQDEDWLRKQYCEKGRSLNDIADQFGLSNNGIKYWLDKYGIERESDEKPHQSEEWLREQHHVMQLSVSDLADECGLTLPGLKYWFEKFGIEVRSFQKPYQNEAWLQEEYCEKWRTAADIADEFDVSESAIQRWLAEFDIETRTHSDYKLHGDTYQNEDWLREQYWENGRSATDIADECGVTAGAVFHWMDRHDIERRDGGETLSDGDFEKLKDEAWLTERYHDDGAAIYELAADCNVSPATICRWLDRHGIDRRLPGSHHTGGDLEKLRNGDWLHQQYAEKDHTMADIADECSVSLSAVHTWIHHHDIETPDAGEWVGTGEDHPRWTGDYVDQFDYGPGWNEAKKEAVRERDDRTCQQCGRTEEEHLERYGTKHVVHHIQKARTFDDPEKRNAMDNLVTLCNSVDCHHRWEKMSPLRPQVVLNDD